MKPYLLYSKYDNNKRIIPNESELLQDLNLDYVLKVMSKSDRFIYEVSKKTILNSLTDIETIEYRQQILKDCINNSASIYCFYDIATKALDETAKYRHYTKPNYARMVTASTRVLTSVGLLQIIIEKLEELKKLAVKQYSNFKSSGMISFCNMIFENLTEDFFQRSKEHIRDLNLNGRINIGCKLGLGAKGDRYVLRGFTYETDNRKSFLKTKHKNTANRIPLDSNSLAMSAREIKDAGLMYVLKIVNNFIDSTLKFFELFRYEIGFYVGCLNLYKELSGYQIFISFPLPLSKEKRILCFTELCDVSLALKEGKKIVCNDLDAINKILFIITGANQGGKSTFLRSVGLAQLFMQCGMFVTASSFSSNISDYIFTHFTKEEDVSMKSGKLDEELLRVNKIIDYITPDSLLLMNESFATTTERDGSKIVNDIISALYEHNIKIFFVTHLYEFAYLMYSRNLDKAVFLRAERNEDGGRSFKLIYGEPLQTSFGEDLFKSILGNFENH